MYGLLIYICHVCLQENILLVKPTYVLVTFFSLNAVILVSAFICGSSVCSDQHCSGLNNSATILVAVLDFVFNGAGNCSGRFSSVVNSGTTGKIFFSRWYERWPYVPCDHIWYVSLDIQCPLIYSLTTKSHWLCQTSEV